MPVRVHHIVIDAHDLPALAKFWTEALRWKVLSERKAAVLAALSPRAGSPRAASTWSSISVIRSAWSSTGGMMPPSRMPTTCGAWTKPVRTPATALIGWTVFATSHWTWPARCAGSGTEIAKDTSTPGALHLKPLSGSFRAYDQRARSAEGRRPSNTHLGMSGRWR